MSAPLYVRDGSRFVPLPEVLLRDVPPIPVPQPVEVEAVVERAGGGWSVPAPKCPHGSFARWAARNCCAVTGGGGRRGDGHRSAGRR